MGDGLGLNTQSLSRSGLAIVNNSDLQEKSVLFSNFGMFFISSGELNRFNSLIALPSGLSLVFMDHCVAKCLPVDGVERMSDGDTGPARKL